jgi:hypothetical protein
MTTYYPHNGMSDSTFHLFAATSVEHIGDPTDRDEAERVEWLRWPAVIDEMRSGRIGDGLSLTALLWRLAVGDAGTDGRLVR